MSSPENVESSGVAPRGGVSDFGHGSGRDAIVEDGLRAEISDLRRALLLRQERTALSTLAGGAESKAADTERQDVSMRTDLLELAVLKLSRDIETLRDAVASLRQSELMGRQGPTLQEFAARLEMVEARILWTATSGRVP